MFMMGFPSRKIVEDERQFYPAGTRIRLIKMDDPQAPPVGTEGTVVGVDIVGSIMVRWDNGSSLSLVYGVDQCQIIEKSELTWAILDQIQKIRNSGKTNMLDAEAVQLIAHSSKYYDLEFFIADHRKDYLNYIMYGD